MASRRRVAGVLAVLGAAGALAACRPSPTFELSWSVEPAAGAARADRTVRVAIHESGGAPIVGARLTLEGHMAHPGMPPVVTGMTERGAGVYDAEVPLSMAGEWMLVVSGTLADGTRVTWEHRIDVEGAAPPA